MCHVGRGRPLVSRDELQAAILAPGSPVASTKRWTASSGAGSTASQALKMGGTRNDGGATATIQRWRDCDERRAPYVVVTVGRGPYADVKCDLLAAYVSSVTEEEKKPLYWLTRDFTAIGGHHWYGVVSGSDRCPRDRAAELAVRLAALGREVIEGGGLAAIDNGPQQSVSASSPATTGGRSRTDSVAVPHLATAACRHQSASPDNTDGDN